MWDSWEPKLSTTPSASSYDLASLSTDSDCTLKQTSDHPQHPHWQSQSFCFYLECVFQVSFYFLLEILFLPLDPLCFNFGLYFLYPSFWKLNVTVLQSYFFSQFLFLNCLLLSIHIHSHSSSLWFYLESIDWLLPNNSFRSMLPGLFQHIPFPASHLYCVSYGDLKFNLPKIQCIILRFLLCFLSYFWCQLAPTIQARKPGDDSYLLTYLLTYLFIYLFIYGCVGSSFLCEGSL